MLVIDHAQQPIEWRGRDKNIEHRTLVSRTNGATQMTLWEIFPPPTAGAPPHVHPHEETMTVLHGRIKAQLNKEIVEVRKGQTLFIPANTGHSFAVVGEETAHLLVAFPVDEPVWDRIDWTAWLKSSD